MILPGHISGGYLATRAILYLVPIATSFSSTQIIILYIVGIIASEGPDFDLIKFFFEHKSIKLQKKDSHRKYISHTPIFWLVISFAIILIGYIFGNSFVSIIGLIILGGSWSHLIFDSLEYGIMWLWPFSHKFYSIHSVTEEDINEQKGTISYYWTFLTKYYIRRWTFYLEIIVTFIALLVFLDLL